MIGPLAALTFGGLAGAALGSFAVTAALRTATGRGFAAGRSACDGCQRPLGFAETVPVLSFAAARGVCSACGGRIDPLHPVGELAGALAGVVGVAVAVEAAGPARGLLVALVGLALLGAAAIDWRVRRLPDIVTALIALAALALTLLAARPLWAHLGWAAGVGAALLALRAVTRRGGRPPGLGLGDVKLLAALALWLGPAMPLAIAAASLLGLAQAVVVQPADRRVPFGPAIALAGWSLGVLMELGLWPPIL